MPEIRDANETDADDIVAVVNAAFQVESKFRAARRTSAAEILPLMQRGTFLVAIRENLIAGAVLVRINGTTGYFGMLAVWPELQRLGIGRALLEAAEDYCRTRICTEITLSTGSFRQELVERYQKLGYKITSIEPSPPEGPFTKAVEIVKMAKEL